MDRHICAGEKVAVSQWETTPNFQLARCWQGRRHVASPTTSHVFRIAFGRVVLLFTTCSTYREHSLAQVLARMKLGALVVL
jgi:hypothetical protein